MQLLLLFCLIANVGRYSFLKFHPCLPRRGGVSYGMGGRGQPLRHCSWWGRSESWASASPQAGHTVKQQFSAGLPFPHSPVTLSCGAFSSFTVLVQDTEGYSNKALRSLMSGAPQRSSAVTERGISPG